MSLGSLQGRLLIWVLGSALVLWCATGWLIWRDARTELDRLLDGHLAQAATLLVIQQGIEVSDGDLDLDEPLLYQLAPKVSFQVWRAGKLLMHSSGAPHAPLVALGTRPVLGFHTVPVAGATWRVFGAYGSEHALQVFVAERLDSREAILSAVLRAMLWPGLAAIPLWLLAITGAVRAATGPLRWLGRVLAQRSPDQADALPPHPMPQELRPVVEALNRLFARMATLLVAERRFTADASHELRTPIAAIRAQAQVALSAREIDDRRHALLATLQGCDRASHLIDQLLVLSRLEAEGGPVLTEVDAVPLVRSALAEVAARALQKDQTLEFLASGPVLISAEAALLGVLVRNLADNAVRYSPRSATVQVTLEALPGGGRLLIKDSGPGMSDEDIQRLGQRFFRVLGSEAEGSGLGWSIVQRIAAVHGARVTVGRSQRLGGLRVEVSWPAPG